MHRRTFLAQRRRHLLAALISAILVLATGLAPLHAQDSENDAPMGPSGSFDSEVTTAGRYDPFTSNAKRIVTDLSVPNSSLAFTRYYNSRYFAVANDPQAMGDGSNWRHAYQWTLTVTEDSDPNGGYRYATAFNVAYPDGSVTTFRQTRVNSTEAGTHYWHGPQGTTDRLYVPFSLEPASVTLLLADGSRVAFANGSTHPQTLTDPHGAVTTFDYVPGNPDYLRKVTEPGGRWLKLFYQTIQYQAGSSWTLLQSIQASTGQTATYTYANCGTQGSGSKPYKVLDHVTYDSEPRQAPGTGVVTAQYTYQSNGSMPNLLTAIDPHFAGPMVGIRYAYGNPGYLYQEQNYNTSGRVSQLDRFESPNKSIETRGDTAPGGALIQRTLTYGESSFTDASGNAVTTNAKRAVPTTVTDYEGNVSHLTYQSGFAKDAYDAKGHVTTYTHELCAGKTTAVATPDGSTTSNGNPGALQRTYTWQGMDGSTTNVTGSFNNGTDNISYPYYLAQTTDERGQTTTYHRAANTGLVQQTDYPDGAHEFYNYQGFSVNGNTFYKVSLSQNKLGGQVTYQYDEANHGGSGFAGLLTSVTRKYLNNSGTAQAQETTNFYYDGLDRVIKSVDQRGVTTLFDYNPRHQLVRLTHGDDNTSVVSVYDDNGNRTSVQDELGHTAYTVYDEYRRVYYTQVPVNAPMANGQQLASRYRAYEYARRNTSHNAISDALSHTSGAYSTTWLPSGSGATRVFSSNGHMTDEYGGIYVNGGYNPVSITETADTIHSSATYNSVGQVKTATDPQNFVTTYNYDSCNRLSTASDPMGANGHTTSYVYNAAGNPYAGLLASTTTPGADAVGFPAATTQCTSYDNMGRLQTSVDPYSHAFDSAFDPMGNLSNQDDGGQTQSANHQTGYQYDQLGRKRKLTYPDGTFEKWTYDASGNVDTFTNRAGAVCTYTNDLRNRCTYYSWSDGTSARVFYYDAANRLIEVGNAYSDIKYTYDDSGALITEDELTAQPTRMVTRYTHDYNGNVDSIKYPNNPNPICYYYDWLNRCRGTYSGGVTNGYYAFSGTRQTLRWLGNGIDTGYAYQNDGRLSYFWHFRGGTDGSHANNGSLSLQFYGYAPDGQVSWTVRQAGGDQTGNNSPIEYESGDAYYYYPDGRLNAAYRNINAQGGWPGQQDAKADSRVNGNNFVYNYNTSAPSTYEGYTYDGAGNRTGGAYQAVDGANRYPAPWNYTDSNGLSNGNTTNAGTGWTYTYDAENHLVSASGPGGASLQCLYDAMDRLVLRVANGVASYFYYAGSQRIEEHNASNQPLYSYVYDAPGSDQILYRDAVSYGAVWYLYDGLGNTTHLCDGAGAVAERYLYSAFGTPAIYDAAGNVRTVSSYENRYLFKSAGGYEWQAQAQLYYARARWYLPAFGRWLQPDPIGQAGGLNIYAYCGNDPVNGIDPSGCNMWDDFKSRIKQMWDAGGTWWGNNAPTWAGGDPTFTAPPVIVTGEEPHGQSTKNPLADPRDFDDITSEMFARTGGTGNYGYYTVPQDLESVKDQAARAKSAAFQTGNAVVQAATLPVGEAEVAAQEIAQAAKATLSKAERLGKLFERLSAADPAKTAEEAMEQMKSILEAVEDKFSGVVKNPSPGLKADGRMYPAQADRIVAGSDGTITATSRAHVTTYGPNGGIIVTERGGGTVIFTKPGGG